MKGSEYALLKRAQSYDEQAIGELYDHYAPLLYAYLYRRVQDAQLAEDLTSEVFVRVLQAIQDERFWHTSFRAWLYRIAHNQVVDYFRHQARVTMLPLEEHLVADSGDDLEMAHEEKRTHAAVGAAIRRLTPDQQQVLTLRFGEQMKTQEVADIMNKSLGAVEALQHRALAALRKMVNQGKK